MPVITSSSPAENFAAGYQAGVMAAAGAFALLVGRAVTPEQTAQSVHDWLASHGFQWNPEVHGFPDSDDD